MVVHNHISFGKHSHEVFGKTSAEHMDFHVGLVKTTPVTLHLHRKVMVNCEVSFSFHRLCFCSYLFVQSCLIVLLKKKLSAVDIFRGNGALRAERRKAHGTLQPEEQSLRVQIRWMATLVRAQA